jgi:hypothetical protein
LLASHAREEPSAARCLLDLLGPPGRRSGCWPHDGEVAGGAVADSTLVISGSGRWPRRSQVRGQLRHDPIVLGAARSHSSLESARASRACDGSNCG